MILLRGAKKGWRGFLFSSRVGIGSARFMPLIVSFSWDESMIKIGESEDSPSTVIERQSSPESSLKFGLVSARLRPTFIWSSGVGSAVVRSGVVTRVSSDSTVQMVRLTSLENCFAYLLESVETGITIASLRGRPSSRLADDNCEMVRLEDMFSGLFSNISRSVLCPCYVYLGPEIWKCFFNWPTLTWDFVVLDL